MRNILFLLNAFVFTLASADSRTDLQDRKVRPSFVHLLRSKRFDFSMFGCSSCRPIMECRSDHECVHKKGRGYTCEFKCCSFVCLIRHSSNRAAFHDNDDVMENSKEQDDVNIEISTEESTEDLQVNLDLSSTSATTKRVLSSESTESSSWGSNLNGGSGDAER